MLWPRQLLATIACQLAGSAALYSWSAEVSSILLVSCHEFEPERFNLLLPIAKRKVPTSLHKL